MPLPADVAAELSCWSVATVVLACDGEGEGAAAAAAAAPFLWWCGFADAEADGEAESEAVAVALAEALALALGSALGVALAGDFVVVEADFDVFFVLVLLLLELFEVLVDFVLLDVVVEDFEPELLEELLCCLSHTW